MILPYHFYIVSIIQSRKILLLSTNLNSIVVNYTQVSTHDLVSSYCYFKWRFLTWINYMVGEIKRANYLMVDNSIESYLKGR